jgi:hypothetical protein
VTVGYAAGRLYYGVLRRRALCTHSRRALCTHSRRALCTHSRRALCTHSRRALCTHSRRALENDLHPERRVALCGTIATAHRAAGESNNFARQLQLGLTLQIPVEREAAFNRGARRCVPIGEGRKCIGADAHARRACGKLPGTASAARRQPDLA